MLPFQLRFPFEAVDGRLSRSELKLEIVFYGRKLAFGAVVSRLLYDIGHPLLGLKQREHLPYVVLYTR